MSREPEDLPAPSLHAFAAEEVGGMMWHGPRGRQGRWAFLFLLLSLLSGPSPMVGVGRTQEVSPEQPPTFELPEVVVPGRRPQPSSATPAAVRVITREELERLGARTVADALSALPDVAVRSYGGLGSLAQASIRGSSPAQVLVLLDGVPLNSVASGQVDLSTISTDAVERIELLPGPFAAIYGSGALGGVINIVTATVTATRVLARGSGFGERSLSVSAGEGERVPWQLSLTGDSTQGYRLNSDFAGTTVVGKLAFSPTAGLLMHYYSADLGLPGDISSPTLTDRQSERRAVMQINWGQPRDRRHGRLYYVTDLLTFISSFGTDTYYSATAGGEFQQVWQSSPQATLVGGVEVLHSALDASVFGSAVIGQTTTGAAYVQYDSVASPRLLASTGLRIDTHSTYGTTVNPRVGLVYQVSEQTRVRFALGRTFRGPTFLDLFYPGCANPTLMPETAWAAEAGVERSVGAATFNATIFAKEATNLIQGFCPPQNVGLASVRGIAVEAKGTLDAAWSGSLNVTVTSAIDAGTGTQLLRVPWVTSNLALHRQVTPSSQISLLAQYVGPRADLDFSTSPATPVQLPGYVDLQFRYRVETETGWVLTVGVDNALDWQYESVKGYPAPGRTAFIAATARF